MLQFMNSEEKEDEPMYYMENGFVVFTASYHLKRGFCCKNGCRHCPYGFKKDDASERSLEREDEA